MTLLDGPTCDWNDGLDDGVWHQLDVLDRVLVGQVEDVCDAEEGGEERRGAPALNGPDRETSGFAWGSPIRVHTCNNFFSALLRWVDGRQQCWVSCVSEGAELGASSDGWRRRWQAARADDRVLRPRHAHVPKRRPCPRDPPCAPPLHNSPQPSCSQILHDHPPTPSRSIKPPAVPLHPNPLPKTWHPNNARLVK